MQLETIAAVVRPRKPWEAVDLGFCMARAWWPALIRPWLAIVLPFQVLVAAALFAYPKWAVLVIWWCKPLYDRVPLFVLSRALFGAVPAVREVRGKMPRLWLAQSLGALTLGRLDPMRSFTAPVGRLEGLSGAARRQRARVLKRGDGDASAASWLTVACLVFELGMLLALVALLDMLRPETVERSFWEIFTFLGDPQAPPWYYALAMALYLAAMSLIEPFYAAAGFALYLNRRTDLEGWDVDLAFRRLARRLKRGEPPSSAGRSDAGRRSAGRSAAAALLAVASAAVFAAAAPAWAREPAAKDPQQAIEEILSDPEFGTQRTVTTWQPRFLPETSEEPDDATRAFLAGVAEILGTVFEWLLWSALAVLAAVLLIAAVRRLYLPRRPSRTSPDDAGPKIVCGLDVSSDALPDDVVAAALGKWRAGRPDEALSLLYRGALARLVDRRRLPARESWTEEDCLRHLEGPEGPGARAPLVEYFARLTTVWQRTAYAHRPPSDDEMQELAGGWPVHFGATP